VPAKHHAGNCRYVPAMMTALAHSPDACSQAQYLRKGTHVAMTQRTQIILNNQRNEALRLSHRDLVLADAASRSVTCCVNVSSSQHTWCLQQKIPPSSIMQQCPRQLLLLTPSWCAAAVEHQNPKLNTRVLFQLLWGRG
jgi:hypothetical protein